MLTELSIRVKVVRVKAMQINWTVAAMAYVPSLSAKWLQIWGKLRHQMPGRGPGSGDPVLLRDAEQHSRWDQVRQTFSTRLSQHFTEQNGNVRSPSICV